MTKNQQRLDLDPHIEVDMLFIVVGVYILFLRGDLPVRLLQACSINHWCILFCRHMNLTILCLHLKHQQNDTPI